MVDLAKLMENDDYFRRLDKIMQHHKTAIYLLMDAQPLLDQKSEISRKIKQFIDMTLNTDWSNPDEHF